MDEHAILYRYARNEDGPAFEALIRHYEPIVRAAALRQVRDPHLAGDIAQAAMLALVRKAGRIHRKQPVGPWLLRVTHYLAIDAIRTNATRRHHERLAARQRREGQVGESPWRNIEPVLDSALHALSDNDRTILTLRYLQDWPIERIAGDLHMDRAAVRQRLSRALRRLRKVLADRGISRDGLIPLAPVWLNRGRQWVRRMAELLSPKGVAAGCAVLILLGGGFVLTRAAMHKSPPAGVAQSAIVTPVGLRARSTIP